MGYRLINHLGCWKNTRRIRKSRATSSLPTSRVVYQRINHTALVYCLIIFLELINNSSRLNKKAS